MSSHLTWSNPPSRQFRCSITVSLHGRAMLEQAVLNGFIESGSFEKHLRKIRKTYMARRDCLVAALQKTYRSVQVNPCIVALILVWELPADFPSAHKIAN